jgi:CelD/BcsL family acetyltransferase involved in cellulose biosynthesis
VIGSPAPPAVTPLRARVVRAKELPGEVVLAWISLQQTVPALDSPYFRPEYVQAVAAVRDDVEVAVLEDRAGPVGFFPFQRRPRGIGQPVGGLHSDFQGVIAPPDLRWDPRALLRACGLRAFRFHHLLAEQEPFRPHHWNQTTSPYVDLSAGFEAYRAARRRAGSREIEQILYKCRKAERRLGPLRLELQSSDGATLDTLLRWKSQQLRATGQYDHLQRPWVRPMLERIRAARGEGFAGVLSALWLGDRLVAVHLGMRSRTVLHWWLPAYDRALAAFSPGQISFLEIARAAAGIGIRRVDLGKGDEAYKARLMSGAIAIAEGAVDLRPLTGRLLRGWHRTVEWTRRSPLRRPLLGPVRWARRLAQSRTDE